MKMFLWLISWSLSCIRLFVNYPINWFKLLLTSVSGVLWLICSGISVHLKYIPFYMITFPATNFAPISRCIIFVQLWKKCFEDFFVYNLSIEYIYILFWRFWSCPDGLPILYVFVMISWTFAYLEYLWHLSLGTFKNCFCRLRWNNELESHGYCSTYILQPNTTFHSHLFRHITTNQHKRSHSVFTDLTPRFTYIYFKHYFESSKTHCPCVLCITFSVPLRSFAACIYRILSAFAYMQTCSSFYIAWELDIHRPKIFELGRPKN